jgi:maleate cis-trans isomerase
LTRLGFIYPGGGAEPDYYRFAETYGFQAFLVGSRIPGGDDHDVAALLQTARTEHIVEAARRLLTLRIDAVLWACTSGSFIVGRAGAEAQVRALRAATEMPATSTSLAFIDALAALGARRVAVLATYPQPASRAFVQFLGAFGVAVTSLSSLDAGNGFDAARIGGDRLNQVLDSADLDGADAVLVPDTALPSLDLVERLEARAGLPVLTANQVTLWAALGLVRKDVAVSGFGRIFSVAYKEGLR